MYSVVLHFKMYLKWWMFPADKQVSLSKPLHTFSFSETRKKRRNMIFRFCSSRGSKISNFERKLSWFQYFMARLTRGRSDQSGVLSKSGCLGRKWNCQNPTAASGGKGKKFQNKNKLLRASDWQMNSQLCEKCRPPWQVSVQENNNTTKFRTLHNLCRADL